MDSETFFPNNNDTVTLSCFSYEPKPETPDYRVIGPVIEILDNNNVRNKMWANSTQTELPLDGPEDMTNLDKGFTALQIPEDSRKALLKAAMLKMVKKRLKETAQKLSPALLRETQKYLSETPISDAEMLKTPQEVFEHVLSTVGSDEYKRFKKESVIGETLNGIRKQFGDSENRISSTALDRIKAILETELGLRASPAENRGRTRGSR